MEGLYMKIGYARISTKDQNTDRQIHALVDAGVSLDNIYIDKLSGKDFNRPQYQLMVKTLRAGDTLVIKALDRFGRNYEAIKKEFKQITDRGIFINVLDTPMLNTDQEIQQGLTSKFIVDLVLSVLGYVAEQERSNIKQRQAEGIKIAKAKNVKFGRPSLDPKTIKEAQALINAGSTVKDACTTLKISRRAYYNNVK